MDQNNNLLQLLNTLILSSIDDMAKTEKVTLTYVVTYLQNYRTKVNIYSLNDSSNKMNYNKCVIILN